MDTSLPAANAFTRPRAVPALRRAAWILFSIAALGQLLMAAYVLRFYGGHAMAGHLDAWNRINPHFYTAGDTAGNASMGAHVALATIVLVGGALQLLPGLRRRAPGLHRWVGRSYLLSLLVMVLSGFYLTWVRGSVGDLSQHLGVSLNGALCLVFGALAWRSAWQRRFDAHRRWALRLYVTALGVYLYRLGFGAWLGLWQAPVGFDPHSFTGPFLTAMSFGQSVLPLLTLEVYLRARQQARAPGATVWLSGLALLCLFGLAMAALIFWLPHLR